jgi:mono/diheme cytochrome c family protein
MEVAMPRTPYVFTIAALLIVAACEDADRTPPAQVGDSQEVEELHAAADGEEARDNDIGPDFDGNLWEGDPRTGDVAAGRDIADRLCAACHAVGRDDASPVPEATPFRLFSQLWPLESLDEALAEGIMIGHSRADAQMPVFQFDPSEIADLMAYLETIQIDGPLPDPLADPQAPDGEE